MTMSEKKNGRPVKEVDFNKIDGLCKYHCTAQEIIAHLNIFGEDVSYNTIERRIKEKFGMTFGEYVSQKHDAFAKPKLRQLQWKAAEAGNVTMLIFLGKNYLGQSDKQDVAHSGEVSVSLIDDIPKEEENGD
jgi:hypothetical protein